MKALNLPLLALAALLAPAHAQQTGTPVTAVSTVSTVSAAPTENASPSAPSAAPLTLATAVALAMAGHADLAPARHELAALEADATQAGMLPNPSIEYIREGQDGPERSRTVQLSIPFELGGKRAARHDLALLQADIGRQVLASLQRKVRAEAVAAFYALYLADQRVKLARACAALAGRSSLAAARRVSAGKISPVEETRARLAEAAVQIELVQARRDWEEARLRMTALWRAGGPSFATVAQPSEALPLLPALPLLLTRLDGAPALAQARLEVTRRQAMARLEQARGMPDLALLVGSKQEGPHQRRQALVGLAMPLPLFDRNQGAVLAALRRSDKAQDELAGAALTLRSELARAHARLAGALEEVAIIESSILPGAQSAASAAARGFELGKFSFLEVLDAQRTLFQSQSQHVKALAEAHRAAADIASVAGPSPISEQP